MQTLALRAPDYVKAAASLIAAHGWCGDAADRIVDEAPGLDVTRAVVWAVAGEGARPRDYSDREAEIVAEVIDHLEDVQALGKSLEDYARDNAGTSAQLVAIELMVAAWRLETDLTVLT